MRNALNDHQSRSIQETLPRAVRTGAPLGKRSSYCAGLADWTLSQLGVAKPVVLISGFWRSGTTWLQECLAEALRAKTVFEPLSPVTPAWDRMLKSIGIDDKSFRHALIPPPAAEDDMIWPYLDRAFRAHSGSRFSHMCRRSIRESLRRRIIVKDVRLQFNLQNIYKRYALPIVHIRRHPGAVIASLHKTTWTWSFADVSLTKLVPQFAAELEPFDSDLISRVAAYWALTECFVDRTTEPAWAKIISYERAVADPEHTIADICSFLGQQQQLVPNFRTPSASSLNDIDLAIGTRLHSWRESLSPRDVSRIHSIVQTIYPSFPLE